MKIAESSIEVCKKIKSVKTAMINCDALHDLLPFLQFKKLEKHSSRNYHGGIIILIKFQAAACYFTKSDTLPWVFFKLF